MTFVFLNLTSLGVYNLAWKRTNNLKMPPQTVCERQFLQFLIFHKFKVFVVKFTESSSDGFILWSHHWDEDERKLITPTPQPSEMQSDQLIRISWEGSAAVSGCRGDTICSVYTGWDKDPAELHLPNTYPWTTVTAFPPLFTSKRYHSFTSNKYNTF